MYLIVILFCFFTGYYLVGVNSQLGCKRRQLSSLKRGDRQDSMMRKADFDFHIGPFSVVLMSQLMVFSLRFNSGSALLLLDRRVVMLAGHSTNASVGENIHPCTTQQLP